MTELRTLVLTHPSCPVQEAEARAIVQSSRYAGKLGPFDISVSELVEPGQLVLINSDEIDKGITLAFDAAPRTNHPR